ncbi:serine hydrolase [Rossellomorea vietnamensis]|uniref:serine hydrolase n=1 Tax=Rossellomorea vietnamensis TaxID=218284 RepID=UPI003D27BF28
MKNVLENNIREIVIRCNGRVSVAVELPSYSFHINGDSTYSAASLIKIPILLEGFRQAQEGKISLSDRVTIPKEGRVGGAGVLVSLSDHLTLTVKDLLTLMIIVSDNTASNLLIERLGSNAIQDLCDTLQLKQTRLLRKLMDFEAVEQGLNNYTSALDILSCLKVLDIGKEYSPTSRKKMLHILHQQQFDTKLPSRMDRGSVYIANKTGELPGVEHDCAIIKFREKTAYIAVLIDELGQNEPGKDTIAQIGKLMSDFLIKDNS